MLAEQIASNYGIPLGKTRSHSGDGEFQPSYEVDKKFCVLVCSTFQVQTI
jgi:hypothetical protein